jgi:UDP-arabinose 4-epimerase
MLPALKRVDAVIHFAASAYVGESVASPRKYFRNNVESPLALMDCVLESEVQLFVFSSSCAVYGVPESLPIRESSPKEPINPHGATKLFFERVLSAYSVSRGLRFAALRSFNAAGIHPSGMVGEIQYPETHLIPLAIRAALGNDSPLTVNGEDLSTTDGTCIGDLIHISDLASAHLKALEYLARDGESVQLNLGSGTGTSIRQSIQLIADSLVRRCRICFRRRDWAIHPCCSLRFRRRRKRLVGNHDIVANYRRCAHVGREPGRIHANALVKLEAGPLDV